MKKAAKKPATRSKVKKQDLKDLSVTSKAGGVKGGQVVAGGARQTGVLQIPTARMDDHKTW